MKLKIKGFTLVELIVVISILAILSTIWFVNYSWYLSSTRDTNRISQLESIADWLQNYKITHKLPIPDNKIDIKVEWQLIWYQWYVWKNVLETISYSENWIDPKDKNYFSYYLTKNNKGFQLLAFLEKEESLSIVSNSDATDYSERYPYVFWEKLWILTDENNKPIQEVLTWSIDINSSLNTNIKTYLDNWEFIQWTWATIDQLRKLKAITSSWWKWWTEENKEFVYLSEKPECWSVSNKYLTSIPIKSSLCLSWNPSSVSDNLWKYTWNCTWKNWWDSISCEANHLDVSTWKCWIVNNSDIVLLDSTNLNLCSWGVVESSTFTDQWEWNKYIWKCLGENGWLNKYCSANHVSPSCLASSKPTDNWHITFTNNPFTDYNISYTKGWTECWFTCKDNFFWDSCEFAPLCWVDLWRSNPTLLPCYDVWNWNFSPNDDNSKTACTNHPDTLSRDYTYTSKWGWSNNCNATYTDLCWLDKYESSNWTCSLVWIWKYSWNNDNSERDCTNKPTNTSYNYYVYSWIGGWSNNCPYNAYLTIADGTSNTNLKSLINSQASWASKVVITNTWTIGPVTSWDLSWLDVTLINNWEIQGSKNWGTALSITTALKLTNNWYIRWWWGKWGNWGKGKNITVNTPTNHTKISGWQIRYPWDRTGAYPTCGTYPYTGLWIVNTSWTQILYTTSNATGRTSYTSGWITYTRWTYRWWWWWCAQASHSRKYYDTNYTTYSNVTYTWWNWWAWWDGIWFNSTLKVWWNWSWSSPSGWNSGWKWGTGWNWWATGWAWYQWTGWWTGWQAWSAWGKSIVWTSHLKPGSTQWNKSWSTSN